MKTRTIIIISIITIAVAISFTILEINRIKKSQIEADEKALREEQDLMNELHKRYGDSMEEWDELEKKYRGDMQLEPIPDN